MEMISGMVVVPLVFPSPDRDVVHVFWCPLYAENNMNGLLVIDWCIEHFYCAMVRLLPLEVCREKQFDSDGHNKSMPEWQPELSPHSHLTSFYNFSNQRLGLNVSKKEIEQALSEILLAYQNRKITYIKPEQDSPNCLTGDTIFL